MSKKMARVVYKSGKKPMSMREFENSPEDKKADRDALKKINAKRAGKK